MTTLVSSITHKDVKMNLADFHGPKVDIRPTVRHERALGEPRPAAAAADLLLVHPVSRVQVAGMREQEGRDCPGIGERPRRA